MIYGAILAKCGYQKYCGFLNKLLLAIALLCVTLFVKDSIMNITDKPIGTLQLFGKNLENVTYSVAFCYSSYFSKTTPMFLNGWYNEGRNWKRICSNRNCERKINKFVIKQTATNVTQSCVSIPLGEDFIRLESRLSNKKGNKLPNIYIYQTGSIYSTFKLIIKATHNYNHQKLIVKNDIIKHMPSDGDRCWLWQDISYDECFVMFMKLKMNESCGCILKNMW